MKIHFPIGAALFLAACVTESPDGPQTKALTVRGRLSQSCPIAVTCDENFDYHAYAGDLDSLNVYFSFKPGIVKDKSGAGVLAAFDYMYFKLSFPSMKTDSSTFYVTSQALWGAVHDSGPFKNEVIRYENGILHGRLRFPVQQLVERIESRSEGCVAGDIAGVCYRYPNLDKPIEYTIDYEVELAD